MITSFYIQNFRSILNLSLDFSYAEGKAPNHHTQTPIIPFLDKAGKRPLPCMAFFGANASGKTNLLKAFYTLKLLVSKGTELSEAFETNLLNDKFPDCTFRLEFAIDDDLFEYQVCYNERRIKNESLKQNDKHLFFINELESAFSTKILTDHYSNKKLADIVRVECSDGEGNHTKLFLHRIGQAYLGLNASLRRVFVFFRDRLDFYANQYPVLLPYAVNHFASALGGDEKEALRRITEIVRKLDIDITDIEITEQAMSPDEQTRPSIMRVDSNTGARHSVQIVTHHLDVNGKQAIFDFIKHESAGTQRVAGLVGLMLYALETGGVVLVDELECSLHPLLMRELVLMFKKRRTNPKGAQLVITTHNTDILDDSTLRLSEIALVRKTVANGTIIRRLTDIKNDGEDIRNVTNFRKQYLAGFYSAIPHPAL